MRLRTGTGVRTTNNQVEIIFFICLGKGLGFREKKMLCRGNDMAGQIAASEGGCRSGETLAFLWSCNGWEDQHA